MKDLTTTPVYLLTSREREALDVSFELGQMVPSMKIEDYQTLSAFINAEGMIVLTWCKLLPETFGTLQPKWRSITLFETPTGWSMVRHDGKNLPTQHAINLLADAAPHIAEFFQNA